MDASTLVSGLAVGGVSVALLFGVHTWLKSSSLPDNPEPNKKRSKKKKKPVKQPEPEPEDEDEPEPEPTKEPTLSKSAKRRLREKQKKIEAKQKEEEERRAAEEAAAAAAAEAAQSKGKKKKKKKKNNQTTQPQQAEAPAPEQPTTTGKKKKKKKKKSQQQAAQAEDVEEETPKEPEGVWEQQSSQTRGKARAKKMADKRQQEQEAADAAGEEPQEVVYELSSRYHSTVIGPAGKNMNLLQDGTDTEITVPKKDSGTQYILIKGTKANIEKCKTAIQQLIKTGISDVTHPDTISNTIDVPAKFHGLLIGMGGSNIKAIQEETGIRVEMPDRGTDSTLVTLVGSDDGVKRAKEAIEKLMKDGYSDITHNGYIKTEISFPQRKLRTLIGPKGQTVKALQADTKTRINIPDKNEEYVNVIVAVIGPADGVEACRKAIQEIIDAEEVSFEPVELPPEEAWGGGNVDMTAHIASMTSWD